MEEFKDVESWKIKCLNTMRFHQLGAKWGHNYSNKSWKWPVWDLFQSANNQGCHYHTKNREILSTSSWMNAGIELYFKYLEIKAGNDKFCCLGCILMSKVILLLFFNFSFSCNKGRRWLKQSLNVILFYLD